MCTTLVLFVCTPSTLVVFVCRTLVVFVCTMVAERGVVCRVAGWVAEKYHKFLTNKQIFFGSFHI